MFPAPGESECSSAMMGGNMYGVLPNRDPHSSLGIHGFSWGSITEAGSTHVMDFNCSTTSTPGDQTDTARPTAPKEDKQAFTIHHIVIMDYLAWPKAPKMQKHSHQAGYSKVIPQEPVKGRSFGTHMVWIIECRSYQVTRLIQSSQGDRCS